MLSETTKLIEAVVGLLKLSQTLRVIVCLPISNPSNGNCRMPLVKSFFEAMKVTESLESQP